MPQVSSHHAVGGSTSGSYLPGRASFPSLFRASAELPPFYTPYRWWEDEATPILWAFDAQEIKRVIRFGLLQDQNIPRSSLQSRNQSTVDAFLLSLVEPQERAFAANLSHIQKVEEIIRRCKTSNPPHVCWSWFPAQKDRDVESSVIANAIDAESHLHFTRISFEELVRYSLGYSSTAVEWFFQQHTAFYIHLYNYLHAFPDEVARFAEVEPHLRARSPFAHRALVRCLLDVQSGGTHEASAPITPGFEFIAGPIQRLFKDLPPSLNSILKVLSLLSVRFQRMYVHSREMSWTRQFNVGFSFLEDILNATSAPDFASTTTSSDAGLFTQLTVQDIVEEGVITKRILAQWDLMSIEVWECCTGLPDLIPFIQECLQTLLHTRNYHALTAILNGLQKYSITDSQVMGTSGVPGTVALNPVIPPGILPILHPVNNFAAYRQQFQELPGLPFLFSHIHEYQEDGQPALRQMFQQMRK
ncbi:hypothetical protein FE257_006874 [Aspergillus nanangensis]|uniref:Ras-GEF domain-containing protein n=1 Tax=Aspergillus nanangensis TaxID=2582783 RepID=A0AAD4GTP6_ASPNN|nr:hypothetical protein FE257_006874 [Aspergillus nanangensis]